jgi:oxygen-independent coproporphyrinogen-3 oxidase
VRNDDLEARFALAQELLAGGDDPVVALFGSQFEGIEGEALLAGWRDFAGRARAGAVHPAIAVYVHVPFCASKCSYCVCASRALQGRRLLAAYVDALSAEIEAMGRALGGLPVSAMHVGGGSPSLLTARQLDRLLADLEGAFVRGPAFHLGVELLPRQATRPKLVVLRAHGVDRVSFGVQSTARDVLGRVNRAFQTGPQITRAVGLAREVGIGAINLDVLAGLPGETETSFGATIARCLEAGPDAINVSRFLLADTPLYHHGASVHRDDSALTDRLLLLADRLVHDRGRPLHPQSRLARAEYGTSYRWGESRSLRNVYEELKAGPASVVALGWGAASHRHGELYSACAEPIEAYVAAHQAGRAPRARVRPITSRFEMAALIARRLDGRALRPQEFEGPFGRRLDDAFGAELEHLEARGVVGQYGDARGLTGAMGFSGAQAFAFLAHGAAELRCAIDASRRPPARAAARADAADVRRMVVDEGGRDTIADLIGAAAATGARRVVLDLAAGLPVSAACEVIRVARASGVAVEIVRRSGDDQFRQLSFIDAPAPFELYCSYFYKRLAFPDSGRDWCCGA